MKTLFVIPARGGSKGIPHKNIKPLGGKPIIRYAIDCARQLVPDEDICVTTDDPEIIKCAEDYGLKVPFVRPDYLATDTMGTYEVLLHALDYYEKLGRKYDAIVLLQPTSPFRTKKDVEGTMSLYNDDVDMVVSVKEAATNPYYNSFEEDENGYLVISKGDGHYCRRQDAPKAWEYNGAVYVINPQSLKEKNMSEFRKITKYEMDSLHSLDLDTLLDWKIAELLIKETVI